MSRRLPLVVIDPGGLDQLRPGTGQFRYVVDLVRGLHAIQPDVRFLFLGGSVEPIPELAEILRRPDSRWEYRAFPRLPGRGAMYREQALLMAKLIAIRPSLVHSLHSRIPLFAPCPVIATVLDLMVEIFPEYAAAVRSRPYRLQRWTIRHRAQRVLCISESTANDVQRTWRVPANRVRTVYPGTSFNAASDGGGESQLQRRQGPIIASPFNLEPRKNLHGLLQAASTLCGQFPGLELHLFGRAAITPERETAFHKDVAALGLTNRVKLTGMLSETDLARHYRRASLFVFPSLYEGFGYPVLEAMACGACVVARNASSMAEIVGDAGVLADTSSPERLAEAMADILTDPRHQADLRVKAQQRAATFTIERMVRQTIACYHELLG